jgi:hypothetical protein
MLNLTLFSISLRSSQTAPFFSQSSLTSPSHWRFHDIRASHFFSPFSHNLFHARYTQCSFTKMLNSAISISTKTYRNQRTDLTLFGHSDDFIEVLDSSFASENLLGGGAINILKEGSTLSIARTAFKRCASGYRGGAISFFGRHLILELVCFCECQSTDSAMALEAHLDPEGSSLKMNDVQVVRCADEQLFQEVRYAAMYLILGAQYGRHVNSTANDASHGGSFGASEDCESFDFQYIISCNNSGESTFEFEQLPTGSIFASVNILWSHQVTFWREEGLTLFVIPGSVLLLKNAAIFRCRIQFFAYHGEITLTSVVTDLLPEPRVRSASLVVVNCDFQKKVVKTIKQKGFKKFECAIDEGPIVPTATASRPSFEFGDGNGGIVTFLICAAISGIVLFAYYAFIKKPGDYEKLGELVALPFER